jgi:hypothetical protein
MLFGSRKPGKRGNGVRLMTPSGYKPDSVRLPISYGTFTGSCSPLRRITVVPDVVAPGTVQEQGVGLGTGELVRPSEAQAQYRPQNRCCIRLWLER